MSRLTQTAKTIPIIIGGFVLILTVVVSVLSVTNKNLSFKSKTKAAGGEVKLSLNPPSVSLNSNEKFTLGVTLETKEHQVQGVDLKIKYDEAFLEIDENFLVNGPFLERVLVKKVGNGVISFSAVTSEAKTINAVLLSLPFTARAKGKVKIEFVPPTLVLEKETIKNILDKTESAEISIQ